MNFAEMVTYARSIPDAIGWKWGGRECHLVECKTSRSDFRRDKLKSSHRTGKLPGTHRWYFTPPGLLRPAEVEELGWGLVEVHDRTCRVIVKAPRTEDRDLSEEMAIMFSACRRHRLGVPFDRGTSKFLPVSEQ